MFTPEDPIQAAREQFMLERFNEQVQAAPQPLPLHNAGIERR